MPTNRREEQCSDFKRASMLLAVDAAQMTNFDHLGAMTPLWYSIELGAQSGHQQPFAACLPVIMPWRSTRRSFRYCDVSLLFCKINKAKQSEAKQSSHLLLGTKRLRAFYCRRSLRGDSLTRRAHTNKRCKVQPPTHPQSLSPSPLRNSIGNSQQQKKREKT